MSPAFVLPVATACFPDAGLPVTTLVLASAWDPSRAGGIVAVGRAGGLGLGEGVTGADEGLGLGGGGAGMEGGLSLGEGGAGMDGFG